MIFYFYTLHFLFIYFIYKYLKTNNLTYYRMSEQKNTAAEPNYRLPSDATLRHAAKLSVVDDKPIMLDYWTLSLDKKVVIGSRSSGEKMLVKSEDEYTSLIQKFYKSGSEFIIITENSIYIVSSEIKSRQIS
jgi:hypothetical protein